jgi:hypothetical protein
VLDENPPLGDDEVAEKEAEKLKAKKKPKPKMPVLDEDPPLGNRLLLTSR